MGTLARNGLSDLLAPILPSYRTQSVCLLHLYLFHHYVDGITHIF